MSYPRDTFDWTPDHYDRLERDFIRQAHHQAELHAAFLRGETCRHTTPIGQNCEGCEMDATGLLPQTGFFQVVR